MPIARFQMPDGKIARFEVPEGTTPESAQSMMDGFDFSAVEQPEQPKQEQGIGRTALEQGLQGATFGFADELTDRIGAGIASLATGEKYGDLLKEARGMSKERMAQQVEQNPATSIAANIGGALLTGGAGATTKAGTATANMLRTGGLGARIGKGALAGAASGGLYGAGASDEGQRLEGAGQGALLGGVVGGAIPVAGAAVKKAFNAGLNKAAQSTATASGEIQKESLSKPLQKVYDRLRADYPDQTEFESVLASLGSSKDKALIQAGGKRVANLGMGSAQYPSGAAKAGEFFDEATGIAPEKLKSTLAKTVSPSTNYSSDVDQLIEVGRAKASPLYNQAFKSNQSVQSPVINKILQTPEGKTALGEAVKNMQNEMARVAKPDAEMAAMVKELSDIGMMDSAEGGVAKGLKLKTLDYVKRSMDDTVKKAIRAGDDGEVRRITQLKNTLISEIDKSDKSGLYAKARSASGDYLSTQKAMEDGLSFLKDDVENISRRMKNMGSAEKQAYRAGVVKTLRNEIDGKYDGQNVARLFQKPATRQKLQDLLSAKDYARLLDEAKVTDDIYKLRNQIVGGSPTAGKQVAAKEFQQAGQDIAVDLATGGYVRAGMKTVSSIAKKMFDGLSDQSAKEVAELLYTKDPKQKYQIIKQLINESKKSGAGLQSTQAAQKLRAFYSISDGISRAKGSLLPATAATGASSGVESQAPLRMTIRPSDKMIVPKPRSDVADPMLERIKMAESGGNPDAKNPNSTASGLYQFTDQTWKDTVAKYGKEDGVTVDMKNDPQAQEKMVRRLAADNAKILTRQLDKEPNVADMYVAHFMGANDAVKLIKARGSRQMAANLFPRAAKANRTIFFDNRGRPRSVEEVYQVLANKVA